MDFVASPRALIDAFEPGYKRLKPFREQALKCEKARAGRHYGEGKKQPQRPINMVGQQTNSFVPLLCGEGVKPEIVERRSHLKGWAELSGLALERLVDEIDWNQTRQEAVERACLGPLVIIRYGMRAGGELVRMDNGREQQKGQPFAELISLDDYLLDGTCTHRRNAMFEGHKYRPHRSRVVDAMGVDPAALMDEVAQGVTDPEEAMMIAKFCYTPEEARAIIEKLPRYGDQAGDTDAKARDVSATKEKDAYALGDRVELADVAVYCDGYTVIVTVPADPKDAGDKFLHMEIYDGPERGPYEALYLGGTMADNPIPIPLASVFMDLGDAADKLANKFIQQWLKARMVFPTARGKARDAEIIREAEDQSFPLVDDPSAIHSGIEFGAPNEKSFGMFAWLDDRFRNLAGNPQLASGQSVDSKQSPGTAREASILQGNSAARMRWMSNQVRKLDERTMRHLLWYLTSDPLVQIPVPYRVPGSEPIDMVYSAASREGDFQDFSVYARVTPIDTSDPAVKSMRLVEVFEFIGTVLMPLFVSGAVQPLPALRLVERTWGIDGLADALGDIEGAVEQEKALQAVQLEQGVPGQPKGAPPKQPGGGAGGRPMNRQQPTADRGAYAGARAGG